MPTHSFRSATLLPVLGLLLLSGCTRPPRPASQPASEAPLPRPGWLKKEPLIVAGNWDSMAIFRRRVGGNPVWQEEDYAREHTEETVQKLKDLGVTMAVIHFYKGYGLRAENEQLEDSRKLTALCKKYGIRVGVYVGSTVAYETFLAEAPDAIDWFVPPYLGRPVFYPGQSFRKRVYFMHPGYREYMKRVLEVAIKDLKVDLIHFDNTSLQAQAPVFYHPQAVSDFRDFLSTKYTPEMRKKRLGFSELRFLDPPTVDRPVTVLNDPLSQEWADFRCRQLAAYYGEMERYIRGLNPEVAVENNPHSGVSGVNTVWEQGVDYPRLLAHTDVVWSEEGNEAGVTPEGVLLSKIRTFKMASALNNSIFTYTGGAQGSTLQMAEAMVYNRRNLGMVGGVLAGYDTPADQRNYIWFYRDNFDLYRDVESRADVAVLHSYASLAYNNDRPWQSTMLFEQALIQGKVPFDIIFDDHLKDLSKYRILVLADQECLRDEQLEQVRRFVAAGGGLVATEHTSLYTGWRQRRRDFGLRDLFGISFSVSPAAWPGSRAAEPVMKIAAARRQVGKGKVVYLPAVEPAVEKPEGAAMRSEYWKLPLNTRELIDAVQWASGGLLSIAVKAPPTVTAEVLEDTTHNRLTVHLINFDCERAPKLSGLTVNLAIPAGRTVAKVTWLSPDEKGPLPLTSSLRNGRVALSIPSLKTYGVAVLELH